MRQASKTWTWKVLIWKVPKTIGASFMSYFCIEHLARFFLLIRFYDFKFLWYFFHICLNSFLYCFCNVDLYIFTLQSGSSLVFSSTGLTPLATQAAGVVQSSSVAAGQQPVPFFRQPAGVHISHYPPNYVHYSQYFSPFYVPPPPAIHHFLGNAAPFPQQPPPGSIFPLPTATAGTNAVKYPISQYKPAASSAPTGQGSYGLNPIVYSSAVSGGNSIGSEDLASSQFKENNVFMTGQQVITWCIFHFTAIYFFSMKLLLILSTSISSWIWILLLLLQTKASIYLSISKFQIHNISACIMCLLFRFLSFKAYTQC